MFVTRMQVRGMGSWRVAKHTVVDSGTTLWYVDATSYANIVSALRSNCGSVCSALETMMNRRCVFISEREIAMLPDLVITARKDKQDIVVTANSYLKKGLCLFGSMRTFGIVED